MDYDSDNFKEIQLHTPSSAVSKIPDNIASVVRQRSRGASTHPSHRHTNPATTHIHHEEHSRSRDDLPAPSPEDLAELTINRTFRGFIPAPEVDEPFTAPFSSKEHDSVPAHPSPTIAESLAPSVFNVASEPMYLSPCQPPNVMRSISDESTSSSQFSASAIFAIDDVHNGPISSIGMTDKFTHKWPIPQPLSYESQPQKLKDVCSTGLRPNHSPASALEDGQGLESNHIARWTPFKWCLFLSVTSVFAYGSVGLICALMTWFKSQLIFRISIALLIVSNKYSSAWDKAGVMAVADGDLLVLITWAASMILFTALLGMTGTLLNSRPILAVYTVLLWPAFISLLSVGYVAYKRDTLSLDHKLNLSWSRHYNSLGRLVIQDSLKCCGFYSSLHAASPSKRCYLRTPLPGCKGNLYNFERQNLSRIWRTVFALVPLHMVNLVVALLCANHMTNTFGKGIIPKQYRLNATDVKADAEKILEGVVSFPRPHASKPLPAGFFRDEKVDLVHSI